MALIASLLLGALALVYRYAPKGIKTMPPAAPLSASQVPLAEYVGSNACSVCHAAEVAAWRGSHHELAMQVADDKSVLGNFANSQFSYGGKNSRFFQRQGKYYVNTDGLDGELHDYEIKYTFGVYPLQQYLIEASGGRMQAFGIAWDSRPKEGGGQRWFHLYPDRHLKAGDPLHWTGIDQTWNFQCAECHSTNLRKGYDAQAGVYHTSWSELDVSCEACHGPGSKHVVWANSGVAAKSYDAGKGLDIALDERRGISWIPVPRTGNAQRSVQRRTTKEVDTCARCHARSARISDDYLPGKPLLDSHRLTLLDEGSYWEDGQIHDEVYEWGAFAQSKMYANGVTCSDCHDPHSLKLRGLGNQVCAQCHQPAKYDSEHHTHHTRGTPGAACAACHMPTTTYMIVHARHDHSLRIPRPDLSVKLELPNACNNCHTQRSARWAADVLIRWTGRTPTGYQTFADAFRAGDIGAPGARGELLSIIEHKEQPPIVRASALARLGRWLAPSTVPTVTRALDDADPIVRLAAVEALAHFAPDTSQHLSGLLRDPVRAVRIEAAHALAGPTEPKLTGPEHIAFDRALEELIAAQTYEADRPEGRTSLGNLYALRGDSERAIGEYRAAIRLDPTFWPAYVNLADFYREHGAESDSDDVLRGGLAHNPKAAALHHALGLSLIRHRRLTESLRELAESTQLDSTNPRYAYVYAVALNDSGHAREALHVLGEARKRHPYNREILSALAVYTARAGHPESALQYAKLLQELEPEDPGYAKLISQIQDHGAGNGNERN